MKINKQITQIFDNKTENIEDQLAIESEFDLILNGSKEYTFFCSPENLNYLISGYLYTHQKIKSKNDIELIDIQEKTISVKLLNSSPEDEQKNHEITFSLKVIKQAMENLNQKGHIFRATGSTHIAGLLKESKLICYFEDISRHNAIHKTIGCAIQNNISLANCALLLSCRITGSIIDLTAETPVKVLCSHSAVSSLGMDKASVAGKSVMGFIRHRRMNLYTGNHRFI